MGAFQIAGQIGAHDIQGGEGFAGVTEQGFLVGVREDGEDVADRVRALWIAQACADEGFGDVGEFGGCIDSFVG